MKKIYTTLKKFFFLYSWLLMLIAVFLFQAQIPGHIFNDDDPNIEQPTRESFSHFKYIQEKPLVVTINDYDNFDVGIDYWEEHATSNPLNPLWLFFGVNASPQNARGSTDGGMNWYLFNPQYQSGTCCDPWSTHTGSGVLIYASGVSGQYIYRSTNNGQTWSASILSVMGIDRNHVSAELTGTGPYANYVYAAITGSSSTGPFARSTDAGLTWTQTFSPSNSQPGVYIAVGPNGSTNGGCVIYVTGTGSAYTRINNFYRSTDGGANFTLMSSLSATGYCGTYNSAGRNTINNARTGTHQKVVMDNSNGPYRGRLYYVYATNDPAGNGNRPDVWMQYSTDQAATWSTRVRVNDNANPTASDQWFPEIWCDVTTGILYIHWYDDRNDPANFGMDVYATYTSDGGQTFVPNQRLTNVTFLYPNPSCSPNSNCYRGDYTGITGNPLTSFSVWGDHRNGNALNMGAYFPDFAMRVRPIGDTLKTTNDSSFHFIVIPGVKLWTKTTKFSASVLPAPTSGTITLTLLNKTTYTPLDSMTTYPDSIRVRVKTSGGVTAGFYTLTVQGNGTNGTPVHRRDITLLITDFVGITQNQIPADFYLYQNFPNPFNPTTNIRFDMAKTGNVKISLYDVTGRMLKVIADNKYEAGSHMLEFNDENFPSGIYFYKLETEGYTETKKMMLIK